MCITMSIHVFVYVHIWDKQVDCRDILDDLYIYIYKYVDIIHILWSLLDKW